MKDGPAKRIIRVAFRILLWAVILFAIILILPGALLMAYGLFVTRDLPQVKNVPLCLEQYLSDLSLSESKNGHAIRHSTIPSDEMPMSLEEAIIATEGYHFLDSGGCCAGYGEWQMVYKRIFLGSCYNSIPDQLGRMLLYNNDSYSKKSFAYRVRWAILVYRINMHLTKQQILWLYINMTYYGNDCYGVGAASEYYFGTPGNDISLAQAAMLVGILPAPSRYNPITNLESAKNKQLHVLKRMAQQEVGFITQDQADEAYNESIKIVEH